MGARVHRGWSDPGEARPNELRTRLVASEFLGDHFEQTHEAGQHWLRVQAVTGPTSSPPEIAAEQILLVTPENLTWFHREDAEPHEDGEDAPAQDGARAVPTTAIGV